ncbi:glycosyltransferase family 2 protein [Aeromonas caviae]
MLITVGIPVYNAEKYISNAIDSILNQTHKNLELLIIDDGSTDNSMSIVNSYSDPRLKILSDGINRKLPYRLNQIIDLAQGEFIMRMDADDFCTENRIEKLLEEFSRDPSLDVVFSRICSVTNEGVVNGIHGRVRAYPICVKDLLRGNTGFPHASLMARKSWYYRNRYNISTMLCEDYELYLNAILKDDFRVSLISDVLYYYREENNVSFKRTAVAYKGQVAVLNNLLHTNAPVPSGLIRLEIMKFFLKLNLSRCINFLNLNHFVFSMRGQRLDKSSMEFCVKEIKRLIR